MRKAQGIANIRGFALAACALLAGCTTLPEPVVEAQAPAPVEVRLPKTVRDAPPRAPVVRPAAPPASEPPEAIFTPAPVGPIAAPRYPGRQQGVARVLELLPPSVTRDRDGWAADIFAAFAALRLAPTAENFCAAIAVIEQDQALSPTRWCRGCRASRGGKSRRVASASISRSSHWMRRWRNRHRTARRTSVDSIRSGPSGR